MVGAVGFFVERQNAAVLVGFDDAELGSMPLVDRDRSHGDLGAFVEVKIEHVVQVHPVDVVAAEDGHRVRVGLLHQVHVLVDGVGCSLVPGLARRPHLRGHRNNELRLQQGAELPAFAQVLQQRLAAELRQHVDRVDARVDEVAEHEVDDTVLASERNGRLGPLLGQRVEPRSFPAGQYDAQHAYAHSLCQSPIFPGKCLELQGQFSGGPRRLK